MSQIGLYSIIDAEISGIQALDSPSSARRLHKEGGKMKKDTGTPNNLEISDGENLRKAVRENISSRIANYITNTPGMSQAKFGKMFGASSSTVNRWAADKRKEVPSIYLLKPIADTIGITVDSLLTGSDVKLAKPKYRTYSAAFLSLLELVNNGLVKPSSEDPFLKWLICTKIKIDNMKNVSAANKEGWIKKVVSDYDHPFLPRYLTQYINLFVYEYEDIEEYDTYLIVFRLFQGYSSGKTKDVIDGLIQRWHNAIKKDTGEFPSLEVPYGGGDKMYALDEDGKIILVDKPQKEVWVEATPDDIPDDDELPYG